MQVSHHLPLPACIAIHRLAVELNTLELLRRGTTVPQDPRTGRCSQIRMGQLRSKCLFSLSLNPPFPRSRVSTRQGRRC